MNKSIKKKSSSSLSEDEEQSLPQTEFDAVLESIPDILIRFDVQGNIVWWNKNLKDVVRLSDKELLACTFDDLFSKTNTNLIACIIEETVIKGGAELEAFLNTVNGFRLYHLKSSLIKTQTSENEVLIVGRDINERTQILEELKNNQTQLQHLIDGLPFFIFLTTPDNIFTLANKKLCDFVGLPLQKIIGFKGEDIFSQNITKFLQRDNDKVISNKKLFQYEGSLEINKSRISLAVDKFPLLDKNNGLYAVCTVVDDVTRQHQLQRQLQQTQKMEAIGQLTGGIAHDFNNVLASIMGYAGLTKKRSKQYNDETILGYLSQITRAGERARNLVQQLLAFSRGDVGALQKLDPVPLSKESLKMLSSLIPSSIMLNLKIRNNNLKHFIEVDPVQFNQSVMNLVINAKDAIFDDIGTIDVSLEYMPNIKGVCNSCHTTFAGKYVRLSVTDNGSGIDSKIISRIFDPFFTTKDVGKGSGMGLSMLHGIVHSSGGHIIIKNNLLPSNNGTVFEVYFPEVKPVETIETQVITKKKKPKNLNKGKRILVIDDEVLITRYLHEVLVAYGYQVVSFNDSTQALKHFNNKSDQFDLIITDQTMPSLTGLELSKSILNSGHNIPTILCSGYTDFSTENLTSEYGVDVFLDKPFRDTVLLEKISSLLS